MQLLMLLKKLGLDSFPLLMWDGYFGALVSGQNIFNIYIHQKVFWASLVGSSTFYCKQSDATSSILDAVCFTHGEFSPKGKDWISCWFCSKYEGATQVTVFHMLSKMLVRQSSQQFDFCGQQDIDTRGLAFVRVSITVPEVEVNLCVSLSWLQKSIILLWYSQWSGNVWNSEIPVVCFVEPLPLWDTLVMPDVQWGSDSLAG